MKLDVRDLGGHLHTSAARVRRVIARSDLIFALL